MLRRDPPAKNKPKACLSARLGPNSLRFFFLYDATFSDRKLPSSYFIVLLLRRDFPSGTPTANDSALRPGGSFSWYPPYVYLHLREYRTYYYDLPQYITVTKRKKKNPVGPVRKYFYASGTRTQETYDIEFVSVSSTSAEISLE